MTRLVFLSLLLTFSRVANSAEQYFHCEYLDAVEANWQTGLIEKNSSPYRQYIGKKFSIDRKTGEIRPLGDPVVMALFRNAIPTEVHKAELPERDNFQLVWRDKFFSGYEQITILNIREGQRRRAPYQFVQITTTDALLSGLCYPEGKP